MRDKDTMARILDVAKLQQWLYCDPTHSINVENQMGALLELSIDEDADLVCRNPGFSETSGIVYNDMLSLPIWMGIIGQLEAQPPLNPRIQAKSRWEEIRLELAMVITVNS